MIPKKGSSIINGDLGDMIKKRGRQEEIGSFFGRIAELYYRGESEKLAVCISFTSVFFCKYTVIITGVR